MNTREKILTAAEKVFSKNGYYMSTMDMIAGEANVAKGTLYYNYPSKVILFTKVIKDGLNYIAQKLKEIVNEDINPDKQFLKCIDFFFDFSMENSEFIHILFNELSGGIDKDALNTANQLIDELAKIIADILKEGKKYDIIRDIDPSIASYALLGAIQGVINHSLKEENRTDINKLKNNIGLLLMKGVLN